MSLGHSMLLPQIYIVGTFIANSLWHYCTNVKVEMDNYSGNWSKYSYLVIYAQLCVSI